MSNISIIYPEQSIPSDDKRLGNLLTGLQKDVTQFSEAIAESRNLLGVGAKTQLAEHFDQILRDPQKLLVDNKKNADQAIKSFAKLLVKRAFTSFSDIIESVFILNNESDSLLYGVILKEDNKENRQLMSRVLNAFDDLMIAEHITILFQFVPKHLESKIIKLEIV